MNGTLLLAADTGRCHPCHTGHHALEPSPHEYSHDYRTNPTLQFRAAVGNGDR